jgi:hypothetical protein
MPQIAMSEIMSKAARIKDRPRRIKYLQNNYSKALHEVMAYGYDERIIWMLPPDPPPYKPLEEAAEEASGMLFTEYKKLYLFVQNGHPNLKQVRRETIFIDLLERLHPGDAKMLVRLSGKKLPQGITRELIEEAFGVYS